MCSSLEYSEIHEMIIRKETVPISAGYRTKCRNLILDMLTFGEEQLTAAQVLEKLNEEFTHTTQPLSEYESKYRYVKDLGKGGFGNAVLVVTKEEPKEYFVAKMQNELGNKN